MAGTTARGSGSTTPGSGGERIAAGNAAGPGSGETGSGPGTLGPGGTGTEGPGGSAGGSTGSAQAQAGPEPGHTATGPTIAGDPESEIHVISTPARARIYLDDVDTREHTPATLKVPRTAKSISITLKLKGYAPFTFESVDAGESSRQEAELVKLKTGGARGRCRTPERPRCVRDARGCCEPEGSGSRRNHHGNKAGSAAQNSDPDGLIRP